MPVPQRRQVFTGVFAALLAVTIVISAVNARPAVAETPSVADAIIERAFRDNGTWQGQCWTFVKKVIEEATGKKMGFDYREGYFEAGAYEVPIAKALPGDVIQLADDSYTAPDADYIGLHTAIIYEVLGGGRFKVIESNANWDETVSTREYDPVAAAKRYPNISVHIYRFWGTPTDPVEPAEPSRQASLRVGDSATVATPGECLNLRSGAGTDFDLLDCLDHRTSVTVTSDVVTVAGRRWVGVTVNGMSGFVAADYLQRAQVEGSGGGPVEPPAPPASPTPAPGFRLFIGNTSSD